MICKKCKDLLGKYGTAPQFNCHECWDILQNQLAEKDKEIERKERIIIDMGIKLTITQDKHDELLKQLKLSQKREAILKELIGDSIGLWNHGKYCDCARCVWVRKATQALKEVEEVK